LDPSPFGGRRSNRLRATGAADSETVDENDGNEDVLSDEEQFTAGDAHVGGAPAALVTPVQPAAAPGAIVFPSTSPFYSSFLLQNMANPNGLHFQSDTFLKFLPSGGQSLSPEAAGLQTHVSTRPPYSDITFNSGQALILTQLQSVKGFDSSLLSSFVFPADGSLASVIISLRDIFNTFIQNRCSSCSNAFQYTILATPDLAAATSGETLDVGYLLTDPSFDCDADPMGSARFYGKSCLPQDNIMQPGFGPFRRYPQGYDNELHAVVHSFNSAQFNDQTNYFGRDAQFQFRMLAEFHRLLFSFFRCLADHAKKV
jgi:hypothetical protein